MTVRRTLYILHYTEPVRGRVTHYIGSSVAIDDRIAAHRSGTSGARLPTLAHQANIAFRFYTLPGSSYADERLIKKHGHYERLCPECSKKELTECKTPASSATNEHDYSSSQPCPTEAPSDEPS
jgi:hypothetical protein